MSFDSLLKSVCEAQLANVHFGVINNYTTHIFCTTINPQLLYQIFQARDDAKQLAGLAGQLRTQA